MEVIDVPGATGYIDTNFSGKAEAAIRAFREGVDLVYLHLEAPGTNAATGAKRKNKVRAIETIDRDVPRAGTGGAGGDGRTTGCWSSPTTRPPADRPHPYGRPPRPLPPLRQPIGGPGGKNLHRSSRCGNPGCLSNGATRLMGDAAGTIKDLAKKEESSVTISLP